MTKYPKGSEQAKQHMAKLRAMRGKKGKGVMDDKPRSTVRRGMQPMGTGGEGIGTDDEDSDSDMEGCGLKESFNNSRVGKAINRFAKRHSGVIKAVAQDPDVQDLYHSKHISPYHEDIDAAVEHFGHGLGIVHIHHHHHLHGEGWLDDAGNFFKNAGNTIKSGFEDKIINPIQQGFQDKIINPVQQKVINPIENLPKNIQSKVQALQGTPAYDMIVNKIGKGYIAKKKGGLATDILHYGIPAAAGTLGSALGTSAGLTLAGGMPMAGLAGGVAGSALGNRLGEQWAAKAQRETGTGIRRRRKRT